MKGNSHSNSTKQVFLDLIKDCNIMLPKTRQWPRWLSRRNEIKKPEKKKKCCKISFPIFLPCALSHFVEPRTETKTLNAHKKIIWRQKTPTIEQGFTNCHYIAKHRHKSDLMSVRQSTQRDMLMLCKRQKQEYAMRTETMTRRSYQTDFPETLIEREKGKEKDKS